MGSAEVFILGQKYTVRGQESQEYIGELAEYVDARMREVADKYPGIHPQKAAILAALGIADELYKFRMDFESSTRGIEARTQEALNYMMELD